jgi:hypothetical protein
VWARRMDVSAEMSRNPENLWLSLQPLCARACLPDLGLSDATRLPTVGDKILTPPAEG